MKKKFDCIIHTKELRDLLSPPCVIHEGAAHGDVCEGRGLRHIGIPSLTQFQYYRISCSLYYRIVATIPTIIKKKKKNFC